MRLALRPAAGAWLLAICLSADSGGQRPPGPSAILTQRPQRTMRISFERSGGFAGMRLAVTLDTDTLTEAQAAELEKLVSDARFFDQPARLAAPQPGADRFVYSVTVEAAGRRHTVETEEGAAPPELRPLLDRLVHFARSQRGGSR